MHFILDRSKNARLEGPRASAEGISLEGLLPMIFQYSTAQSEVQTVIHSNINEPMFSPSDKRRDDLYDSIQSENCVLVFFYHLLEPKPKASEQQNAM